MKKGFVGTALLVSLFIIFLYLFVTLITISVKIKANQNNYIDKVEERLNDKQKIKELIYYTK